MELTSDQSEHLSRWLTIAKQLGFSEFLTPADGFSRCVGEGRKWPNSRRSGIYFWLSEDGEAYVGQSVVPRSRLHQHLKDYGDLVQAAFQSCPQEELDQVERLLIREAEKHFLLRNIKHAVSTARQVPFDHLVTPDEQAAFVSGENLDPGTFRPFEQLDRLQARKFERLSRSDIYDDAVAALRLFISRAIPRSKATEVQFWSVTVRPDLKIIRINVGHQEVFTFEWDRRRQRVRALTDKRVSWVNSWPMPYQIDCHESAMRPDRLDNWLSGERLLACRRLVIQLMRHTQPLNSASHCPQIVRIALQ